jgi:hypothetical protein
MKKFRHIFSFIVIALSSSALIYGCSSTNSGTTPPTTNTTVTPKAGTTYTYNKHEIDSSSTGKTSGDTVVNARVISSDTTFAGKSHVVVLYDDFDTMRYVIESNGDVSFYRASFGANGFVFANPTPWMTLPFGSKSTNSQIISGYDTIPIPSLGTSEIVTISGIADYLGTDEEDTGTTTKVKLASGGQARLTITITGISPLPVTGISSTQIFSFDNSIGYYFHSISKNIFPDVIALGFKGSMTSNEKTLMFYNLIK